MTARYFGPARPPRDDEERVRRDRVRELAAKLGHWPDQNDLLVAGLLPREPGDDACVMIHDGDSLSREEAVEIIRWHTYWATDAAEQACRTVEAIEADEVGYYRRAATTLRDRAHAEAQRLRDLVDRIDRGVTSDETIDEIAWSILRMKEAT